MSLKIVDHPLAQHLLSHLRDASTPPAQFRQFSRLLSQLLIIEATRELPTRPAPVQTPLEETQGHYLGQSLAVVPVLRAGLAMLEPALDLFPEVGVGYIGLERNHDTAIAHSYYCKLPNLVGKLTLCVDPMLATGGSASQAISLLKAHGADQLRMVSVIASPEGAARLQEAHPDVDVWVAGLDRGLNDKKYIVPGLGDFGDRLYGTL
ncbi:MAG TPA: uracil phosphoribosyltransferase [Fimbriimonadaceae bacterium]|nr:uracil phosphoribosyltransferase [Fimbriimonadaceae bacterium]HRJ31938.1 uracil phosphoribosyltransferase [Fimbriimonadaceae bacterium]